MSHQAALYLIAWKRAYSAKDAIMTAPLQKICGVYFAQFRRLVIKIILTWLGRCVEPRVRTDKIQLMHTHSSYNITVGINGSLLSTYPLSPCRWEVSSCISALQVILDVPGQIGLLRFFADR